MQKLLCLVLLQRSLNLSSFKKTISFGCSAWLLSSTVFQLTDLFFCFLYSCVEFPLGFSVVFSVLVGSFLYFLFVEVLNELIHSSLKSGEHHYAHYFEFLLR